MSPLIRSLLTIFAIFMLNACDSSSDSSDSETDTTYFKIYNASPNASTSYIYLDEDYMGSLNFASSFANYALNDGDYELSISRLDENGEALEILAEDMTLRNDFMSFYMLVGDYTSPELVLFEYDTTTAEDLRLEEDEEGDEQFELYLTHLSADSPTFDIYLGPSDGEFNDATLAASLAYKQVSELKTMIQDDYRLYLTETGSSEVLFTSTEISLDFLDTFILAIRDNFGPSELAVDRISGFSAVVSHLNEDSAGEIQFYQSDNSIDSLDIYTDVNTQPILTAISADTLSDKISLDKGAYSFSMTSTNNSQDIILKNLLLNINQGDVKTMILYRDADAQLQGISFDKQARPLAYESAITVVNLAHEFEDIDVFFVASDENLDTAGNVIRKLEFANNSKINLLQQEYQIFITHELDNGSQQLLYQSAPVTLNANLNYFFIIEPDENEFSGYRLNIIEE